MIRLIIFCSLVISAFTSRAQQYNALYTDKARLIAGVQPQSHFLNLFDNAYVQSHKREINKSWAYVKKHDINAIRSWRADVSLLEERAPQVLFYPFSGPDFLYAHAFFPEVDHYIMGGLEKCGSMPPLKEMTDSGIKNYLFSLRHSFRYMNKVGYFVTRQMLDDFESKHFNGAVHVIAYYLVRTGHVIHNIRYFHLSGSGSKKYHPAPQAGNHPISGLEMAFSKKGKGKIIRLDYFSMDLSNQNLKVNPELFTYLNKYQNPATFLKSASYLLHNADFADMRNYIMSKSMLILQDATGVPYKLLDKNDDFNTVLYGSYTKPISDFDYRFQPGLKKALEEQKKAGLPFRIGYGSWNNETVLILAHQKNMQMAARSNESSNAEAEPNKGQKEQRDQAQKAGIGKKDGNPAHIIRFKVQFYLSQYRISPQADRFNGVPDVGYYVHDNVFKYTSGNFKQYSACKKHLQEVRRKGFESAFIAAFKKGKRIPVSKAVAHRQKNK